MNVQPELISSSLPVDTSQAGNYTDGPFKGRPMAAPFKTVLLKLSRMGVNPLVRQFDETDKAYVQRMNLAYTGQFDDVLASGVFDIDG